MKRLLAIAAMGLAACLPVKAQTTYSFSWTGNDKSSSGDSMIMNVPDINTTHVNVITLGLANGCDSDQVYSYDAATATGPALVVGEWIKVVVTNLPGYSGDFQIVALGTDASGNPTFTVNHLSCFNGGSGQAWAGSSANPFFYLSAPASSWEYGVTCDPSKSVFHFTLLRADGSLTNEISAPNTVTCSIPHNPTTRNVTLTGQFSSTLSTGEAATGTFTTSGYIGIDGKYHATTASWTITFGPSPDHAHCVNGVCGS